MIVSNADPLVMTTARPDSSEVRASGFTTRTSDDDYDPELERLSLISKVLTGLGYEPALVKEHPDIPELSNEEKVRVFAVTTRGL